MSYDFNKTDVECPTCKFTYLLDDWVNHEYWCSCCHKSFKYNKKGKIIHEN